MQSKPVNRVKIEYNIGKVFAPSLIKMVFSVFLSIWLLLLVFIVFGALLVFDNKIVSFIVNIAFIALCAYFFYNRGLYIGSKHAASSEIAFKAKLVNEPYTNNINDCFNKWRGFMAVIIAILPFFIVACVFAINTQKQYYQLGNLPQWIEPYMQYNNLDIALGYYKQNVVLSAIDILRLFVRGLIMPYISMFNKFDADTILLIERLSPLLLLIIPSTYGFAYMNGTKQRLYIHKAIATNKKRQTVISKYKKEKKSEENHQII